MRIKAKRAKSGWVLIRVRVFLCKVLNAWRTFPDEEFSLDGDDFADSALREACGWLREVGLADGFGAVLEVVILDVIDSEDDLFGF